MNIRSNASEKFKKNALSTSRQSSVKISFDDEVFERHGVYSMGVKCEGGLMTSVMKTSNFEIFGKHDLKDKEVKIELGFKEFGDERFEYITLGYFVVDEFEYDDKLKTTVVEKAYDKMALSMVKYEPIAPTHTFPMTLKSYVKAISNKVGLNFVTEDFVNSDLEVPMDLYENIEETLYRDIYDEVAMVTGGSLVIKNNNELHLIYPNKTEIELKDGMNIKESKMKEHFGKVNTLAITKEVEDVVYVEDESMVEQDGRIEVKIPNNEFANQFDREHVIKPIFDDVVKGFEYTTSELDTFGFGFIDYYDYVTVMDRSGNVFETLITDIELKVSGGVQEKFFSEIPELTVTDYETASKVDRDRRRTQAIIDKQNGKIEFVVEEVGDLNESVSKIELDMNEILLLLEQRNSTNLWTNSSGVMGIDGYEFDVEPIKMNDADYPLIMGIQDYVMGRQDKLFTSIPYRSLAENAFNIAREGMAISMPRLIVFKEEKIYFHTKITGDKYDGNFIKFSALQLDGDKQILQETPLGSFVPDGTFHHLKHEFIPREDTEFISIKIVARGTPKHPVIMTEGMMSYTDYAPYDTSSNDVLEYAKSQIQLLDGNINLLVEKTEKDIDGLGVRLNRAEIDLDAVEGITAIHEDAMNSSKAKLSANKGLETWGNGITAFDQEGRKVLYLDTNTGKLTVLGHVEAESGFFKGHLESVSGKIGSFQIQEDHLRAENTEDDYSITLGAYIAGSGGDRYPVYVGRANYGPALFTVDRNGGVWTRDSIKSLKDIIVAGLVSIGGQLQVTGDSFLKGAWTVVNGNLKVDKNTDFRGDTAIYGPITSSLQMKTPNGNHRFASPLAGGGVMGSFNSIFPNSSGTTGSIGGSSQRYSSIYLRNQPNVSSDLRMKELITDIPESLLNEFINIKPKTYVQGGEIHFGYIAQDVERAIYKYCLDKYGHERAPEEMSKYAVLHKDESYMSLLYGEIQILKNAQYEKEIIELKEELEELKQIVKEVI